MEKMYEKIVGAVPVELLLKELQDVELICKTNMGDNHIYITNHHKSLNIMKEIGRLREIGFRSMGAGTGKEVDIDEYDIADVPFDQLIVWDPDHNEITGAYRFIVMSELIFDSPTSYLFDLQLNFQEEIKPYAIELGRSFVNFDSKKFRYALHNLWDGLSYLTKGYPNIKYFFGKMTLYPWLLEDKLDVLLSFLDEMFPSDKSVVPKNPIVFSKINDFVKDIGLDSNRKKLREKFKEGNKKSVPPLVNAYVKLSETMKFLGASVNARFGDVVEGCILLTIADIDPEVLREHTKQLLK